MEAVQTSIAERRDRSKLRQRHMRWRQPVSASLSNARAPGPPSIAMSCNTHEEWKWLLKEEEDTVVKYTIECADCNFPFSHQRIKEHVNEIASTHWGNTFPKGGVGKQWTYCFVSNHHEELKAYWSHSLDSARAWAVNPITKEGYFTLLKEVIKDDDDDSHIKPECIYAADESGFQKGVGQKEWVFEAAGKKTQHQQRSRDRENITVIVTICGDGTAPSPMVIFKGEGFQVRWKQDNPLNALYCICNLPFVSDPLRGNKPLSFYQNTPLGG